MNKTNNNSVYALGGSPGGDDKNTEIEFLREKIKDLQQNRKMREFFSYLIYGFVVLYIITVLVFVFLIGFNVVSCSNQIMITLLSTTTANVIALFAFVARYLFNVKQEK